MLIIIVILFFGVYIVFWAINYFRLYFPLFEYENYFTVSFWILFFVLGLIVVILNIKYLQYYSNKTKLKELEKFETMKKDQRDSIMQQLNYEQNNQEYIKKQISNIKELLLNNRIDEAQNIFSNIYMNIQVNSMTSVRYCSNTYINAVLYNKLNKAKNLDIKANYNILLPEKDNLDILDLPTILFNILDNAIHVNSKSNTNDRYINLRINYNEAYITIYLNNSIDENSSVEVSDRLDHGYGLEIVESIVRKYDGNCVWENNRNHFDTKIILKYNLGGKNLK